MTDWRTIRLMDCDFDPRARYALVTDHGPAVTLGELDDKSRDELVRSANVGARTLKHLDALLELVKEQGHA